MDITNLFLEKMRSLFPEHEIEMLESVKPNDYSLLVDLTVNGQETGIRYNAGFIVDYFRCSVEMAKQELNEFLKENALDNKSS